MDHVDTADFPSADLDRAPVWAIKLDERLVEVATRDAAATAAVRAIL
jgi:hypothetical protein